MPKQTPKHIPVLLEEVLDVLNPKGGEGYLDLTAGYGGHAGAVLERTENSAGMVLVDRDADAAKYLKGQFSSVQIISADFVSALKQLAGDNRQFDMILADLGVSSPHLENSKRGFSLKLSGPLDMRMDQKQGLNAAEIVNTYDQKQLEAILRDFGEEPKARQIAAKIVAARPIQTTEELASIASSAWPGYSRIHPATRTFQALRIAVNDELRQLEDALPLMLDILAPDGRMAIISFHSLEDRIVKDFLAENSHGYEASLKLLTKKPLLAPKTKTVSNPRARSAKLRAAAKINTKIERK